MRNKKILYAVFLTLMLFMLAFQSFSTGSPPPPADDSSIRIQATPLPPDEGFTPGAPPLSLTIITACMCLAFLGVISVIVLGIFVRRENQSMDGNSSK